jgi:hypothetical protein
MRHLRFAAATLLIIAGCASSNSSGWQETRAKASDPQLTGKRDMNYDHLIVPGVRIGPVVMGSRVRDAVQHLGQPDHISRLVRQSPQSPPTWVQYIYKDECINFYWFDTGLDPTINQLNVTCDKWSTAEGAHVGLTAKDVISLTPGQYCIGTGDEGELIIYYKQGILYQAEDRNKPVWNIGVMPTEAWHRACPNS